MTVSANSKPTILWLLQNNQVTPLIADFLKLLKNSLKGINIQFISPAMDEEVLKLIKDLEPLTFQAGRKTQPPSEEIYKKKRELIHDGRFKDGLEIWKVLILDDLGAGVTTNTQLALPLLDNIYGIILQIPTPLGSASQEEILFYEWLNMAKNKNVFIAGYELLPLYGRWTLAASMLDGIITNSRLSYQYLTDPKNKIKSKVWKLTPNESKVFSPGTSNLWHNGLHTPYHYRNEHQIKKDNTILYLPHNVAMTYEYRKIIEEIAEYGNQLHLMFSIGKDQVRGSRSHQEIIEIISRDALEKFSSYSFHDLNSPWEMTMANAVVSINMCYSTMVAEANGIPTIVLDEMVPEARTGNLAVVNSRSKVKTFVKDVINRSQEETQLSDIIFDILHKKHPLISLENGS